LRILTMALSFATTPINWIMTFEATISYVGSITTTSTTNWSSWVM
jgi:hypothetical protein